MLSVGRSAFASLPAPAPCSSLPALFPTSGLWPLLLYSPSLEPPAETNRSTVCCRFSKRLHNRHKTVRHDKPRPENSGRHCCAGDHTVGLPAPCPPTSDFRLLSSSSLLPAPNSPLSATFYFLNSTFYFFRSLLPAFYLRSRRSKLFLNFTAAAYASISPPRSDQRNDRVRGRPSRA
jgi:hypothetical protein